MARSDTDEFVQGEGTMDGIHETHGGGDALDAKTSGINSGNFMVSCVHDPDAEEDQDSENSDITTRPAEVLERGFDFQSFPKEPSKSYQFGDTPPIDSSLSTLFQCMTLAYRSVVLCLHGEPFPLLQH